MTAPVHSIPAGSPPDASAALSLTVCAAEDDIPAPPTPDAPAVQCPPAAAGAQVSYAALTPTELKTLDFIRDRIIAMGFAPTLEEIAAEFGWAAKSSAHRVVEALVGQGLLVKTAARKRALALPDGPLLSSVPTAALRAELARRQEVI